MLPFGTVRHSPPLCSVLNLHSPALRQGSYQHTSPGMSNRTVLFWGGLAGRRGLTFGGGLAGRRELTFGGGLAGRTGLSPISRCKCTLSRASTTPSLSTTGYSLQSIQYHPSMCVCVCACVCVFARQCVHMCTYPSTDSWETRSFILATVALPTHMEATGTRPSPTSSMRGCMSAGHTHIHMWQNTPAPSHTPPLPHSPRKYAANLGREDLML